MGREDGREDHPHPGAGPEPRAADGLPRRLGRGPDHRSGADVPGPPRRRPDLPQRGEDVGPGAAGLRALRPLRGRRRLHPGLLRRRDHARRQRLDVPRLTADGADGDRRGGDARGDGRSADAHRRLRMRPLPRQDRRGGDRDRQGLPRVHADELPRGAAAVAPGRARSGAAALGGRSRRREDAVRHPRSDRGRLRRRNLPRGPRPLGEGARRRLRAPRRPGDRDRRQPAEAEGRRAVRRLLRQGRPLHQHLQRLQHPAALPRRRARLHDRQGGRAAGDHPPRREDGQRGQLGDRAEDLGGRPQGLRRRPLRDGGPGLRARCLHRPTRARRSP